MIDLKNGEGTIEKRIPAMYRMFLKRGIDMRKEPILVYPTLHYQNGGLDINTDCMTGVENLYAAGSVLTSDVRSSATPNEGVGYSFRAAYIVPAAEAE